MGMAALLYMITMTAAFETFGTHCDAVILTNYSSNDPLMNMARLGLGLSIIASFPISFSGLREAVIALLKRGSEKESDWDMILRQDVLSMCMLALITCLALVMSDTGAVVELVGGVCGNMIIFIVPFSLYAASIQTFLTNHNSATIVGLRLLIVFAVVMAVAGVYSEFFR
jgi:amino acid permease